MEPIIGTKRVIMSPYLPIRPDLSTTPGDFLSILASLSVSNSSFVAEFAFLFCASFEANRSLSASLAFLQECDHLFACFVI